MKKTISFIICLTLVASVFATNNSAIIKFLKGNISDKTSAVTNSSGTEAALLSSKAMEFALETKEILGNDRDLEALAVAAVLSISPDYVKNETNNKKLLLESQLIQMFKKFSDSSIVQITILSKLSYIDEYIPTENFTKLLNDFLKQANILTVDKGVFEAAIKVLEGLGNNETFLILYSFLSNENYSLYKDEIKSVLASLVPVSMNEIISLIHNEQDRTKIIILFSLIKDNPDISHNNLCEIAENILVESILLLKNTENINNEEIELQLDALTILSENKLTRASSISISYFAIAKDLYEASSLSATQFKTVIDALPNIAPIDSVNPLTNYLTTLNTIKEEHKEVNDEIILAVINALGAIGDKTAFDSLLAVSYLDYNDQILQAARKALSGLRFN